MLQVTLFNQTSRDVINSPQVSEFRNAQVIMFIYIRIYVYVFPSMGLFFSPPQSSAGSGNVILITGATQLSEFTLQAFSA